MTQDKVSYTVSDGVVRCNGKAIAIVMDADGVRAMIAEIERLRRETQHSAVTDPDKMNGACDQPAFAPHPDASFGDCQSPAAWRLRSEP